MKTHPKWLNDIERERFTEEFYRVAPSRLADDLNSPNPWGRPWHWCADGILEGETVEEMAKSFYEENEEDIRIDLKEYEEWVKRQIKKLEGYESVTYLSVKE